MRFILKRLKLGNVIKTSLQKCYRLWRYHTGPNVISVCFSNRNLGVRKANGLYSAHSRSKLADRLGIRKLQIFVVHVQNNFHRQSECGVHVYTRSIRESF